METKKAGVPMTYFRYVSIVLGGSMILGGLWVSFAQGWWNKVLVKFYPERRPLGFTLVAGAFSFFFLVTCYFFIQNMSLGSFVVTLVVSISFLKTAAGFFFYPKVREMVFALMEEPLAFRVVMMSAAAAGLALLMMGIFF